MTTSTQARLRALRRWLGLSALLTPVEALSLRMLMRPTARVVHSRPGNQCPLCAALLFAREGQAAAAAERLHPLSLIASKDAIERCRISLLSFGGNTPNLPQSNPTTSLLRIFQSPAIRVVCCSSSCMLSQPVAEILRGETTPGIRGIRS